MIYWQLLWVYLKIGMFGFGGGYAMLSLIQHEIVDIHHWLTPQQFTDVVAISQQILVKKQMHVVFRVVYQSERRHAAWFQSQILHHPFRRGEREFSA